MKSLILLPALMLALVFSTQAQAQTANPGDKFVWDQTAPSLAIADAYTVTVEMDGIALPNPQDTTCTGTTSPYLCSTPIPPLTPGAHAVRLKVNDTSGGVTISSLFSDLFNFILRAVPARPTNLRIG